MRVRRAEAGDGELLFAMLLEAMNWAPDRARFTVADVLSRPELAHYVAGFPRPGDLGVVAEDGEGPLGAAWWRTFGADDPGYGFVDESTPEVSIGVLPTERGRGIGTLLLAALAHEARAAGLGALSLSVEFENRAARLYRRAGYQVVGDDGSAFTMVLPLPTGPVEVTGPGPEVTDAP